MFRNYFLFILFSLSLLSYSQETDKNRYSKAWERILKHQQERSALSGMALLDSIYDRAIVEGNDLQVIKTLLARRGFIEISRRNADYPQEIRRLETLLPGAAFPYKALMQSMLADWYWRYYQKNRRHILKRKITENFENQNIKSWHFRQFADRVSQLYSASLENAAGLQAIPLHTFDDILLKTKRSLIFRPTLYDFLSHRAIDFWAQDEAAINRFSSTFFRDTLAFAPAKQFANWQMPVKDSTDFSFLVVKTLQNLTTFHIEKNEAEARVDLALKRFQVMRRFLQNDKNDSLYLAALEKLEKTYRNDPASAFIAFERANFYFRRDDKKILSNGDLQSDLRKAYDICQATIARFPGDSVATHNCQALIGRITDPKLNLTLEKTNLPNQPFLGLVTYQNVKKIYLRAIPVTPEQLHDLNRRISQDEGINTTYPFWEIKKDSAQLSDYRNRPFSKAWSVDLPDPGDFHPHNVEIEIPALPRGLYLILVSTAPAFLREKGIATAVGNTWVTNISFLLRSEAENDHIFYLLDRESGKPLRKVKADFYMHYREDRNTKNWKEFSATLYSDRHGQINLSNINFPGNVDQQRYDYQVNFRHGEDRFFSENILSIYRFKIAEKEPNPRIFAKFFTDRAIYRPGQTVHFKGILVRAFQGENELLKNTSIHVKLKDANYREVASELYRSNEFGAFSGSFILPPDRLTGRHMLETEHGSIYFKVEAYKRPRLEITMDLPAGEWRLGDSVGVNGKVKTYAGSNVSGATIYCKVQRERQGHYYTYRDETVTVLQDTIQADAAGRFQFAFLAKGAGDVAEREPSYQEIYRFSVDVTAVSPDGETRHGQANVRIGKVALEAFILWPEQIDRDAAQPLTLRTTNLNTIFQATQGSLAIYRLEMPDRVLRKRPWSIPDQHILNKSELRQRHPYWPWEFEDEDISWGIADTMMVRAFDTAVSDTVPLPDISRWPQGRYRAVLKTKDKFGQAVTSEHTFTLYSLEEKALPAQEMLWHKVLKVDRESVEIIWGSAEKVIAFREVYVNNQLIKKDIKRIKGKQRLVVPLAGKMKKNVRVKIFFVKHGRLFELDEDIFVREKLQQLTFHTETFRNKLAPGEKEEWRIKISGPDGERVNAEMLAAMYDATLDAFNEHEWRFSLSDRHYNRGDIFHLRQQSLFDIKIFNAYGENWRSRLSVRERKYDSLNWFKRRYYQWNYQPWSYDPGSSGYRIRNLPRKSIPGHKLVGVVMSTYGEPLPGVNVIIEGTSFGASTDVDGYFVILLPKGMKQINVRFNFIGYQDLVIRTRSGRFLEVSLTESTIEGEGVVIAAERHPIEMDRTNSTTLQGKTNPKSELQSLSELPASTSFSKIEPRKNFQETAFFYPHLRTNEKGEVIFSFTMPEALTRWRMLGFAHTKYLQFGQVEASVITQKTLMIFPHAPRFFREGDSLRFTAQVANLSDSTLSGTAMLQLFDTFTMQPLDTIFGNAANRRPFVAKRGESAVVSWQLEIPEGYSVVTYRVLAQAGRFSDGEENSLPVLSRKQLVAESLPLSISGKGRKEYKLEKLLASDTSTTLRHQKLTLEFSANPVWSAVLTLPYMMEYPHECAEQTFSRYYANMLASHIVNSNPDIKRVFENWQQLAPGTFLSNLEKNEPLKSIFLEVTPWVRAGKNESARKQRIARLFERNNMERDAKQALDNLTELQFESGEWPWFAGMVKNEYITRHILVGFGHLQKLRIIDWQKDRQIRKLITSGVASTDHLMQHFYEQLLARAKEKHGEKDTEEAMEANYFGYWGAHYLYMRSFFPGVAVNENHQEAFAYWKTQAKKYWEESDNVYIWGMVALALHRLGDRETPQKIVRALRENAVHHEELGMYWDYERGFYWYQAPIETQATLVEVFEEVANDRKAADAMRLWLLKQKQTTHWPSTKATAQACYALLLGGTDWLSLENSVAISLGEKEIAPEKMPEIAVEAGSGYFQTSWQGSDISPEMGKVAIEKRSDGPAWGALYWQYFEDLGKITPHATPLKLERALFKKIHTAEGEKIIPIEKSESLKPGDEVIVRMTLHTDRRLEYVHLKDMRASGFEPVMLSGYKWQGGLGYYKSTRDNATHFFIARLPKGSHVLEYPLRVAHSGDFSNGIATIQCMYAPEFSAHSAGLRVQVSE